MLDADAERRALLEEAERAADPLRIAEIQTRLVDIDADAAPARAARILAGLGFDERGAGAAARPSSPAAGGCGWRWPPRCSPRPTCCCSTSRPTISTSKARCGSPASSRPTRRRPSSSATTATCSTTSSTTSSFSSAASSACTPAATRVRAAAAREQALQAKAPKKQEERRKHLQAFVDRFRAKATKATQAQSRLKMLAKMEPIAAVVDETVAAVPLPADRQEARPADRRDGEGQRRLRRPRGAVEAQLTLADDDRIGLLGANGNGKSTFAKLVAGRLEPMAGEVTRAAKLKVGYFAQHQVDELESMRRPRRRRGACAARPEARSAPARRRSALPPTAPTPGSPPCRAARRRGCCWRWPPATRRNC